MCRLRVVGEVLNGDVGDDMWLNKESAGFWPLLFECQAPCGAHNESWRPSMERRQ